MSIIKYRISDFLFCLLFITSFLTCGGGKEGDVDVKDVQDTAKDTSDNQWDIFEEIRVKIIADVTEGNAPLTVKFDATVEGLKEEDAEYLWDFGNNTYSTQKTPEPLVFVKAGDYKVMFKATNKHTLESGKNEIMIHVKDYADITVGKVKIVSATEIAPGEQATVSFDVFNKGDKITQNFTVGVFLSKDEILTEKDVTLAGFSIEGMDDGRYQEVKKSFDNTLLTIPKETKDGSYFIIVRADTQDAVKELNEENNTAFATSLITINSTFHEKPDLVVNSLTFAASLELSQKEVLSYQINIGNIGVKVAKNFKFAVWASMDETLGEDDIKFSDDQTSIIFVMNPNQNVLLYRGTAIPEGMKDGIYRLIAMIDYENIIGENNEENNVLVSSNTFTVKTKIIEGFDLKMSSITITPQDTFLGGSVMADLVVDNPGNKSVPKYSISYYLSEEQTLNPNYDTKLGEIQYNGIEAGGEAAIQQVINIPNNVKSNKDYYISAFADMKNALKELDEGNNWKVYDKPVHVFKQAFVDLTLSELYIHPKTVEVGKEIKIGYTMGNNGSTTAGAFFNYIVLSQDSTISKAEIDSKKDLLLKSIPYSNVSPGAKLEKIEKIVLPVALPHEITEYYIGVLGDAENNITSDTKKDNNNLISGEKIKVLGPQGGCFEDKLEPNNFAEQATLLTAGKTEKLGLCAGEDWFKIFVPANNSLFISMNIESPLFLEARPYDADLELYDSNMKTVDLSTLTGNLDQVEVFTVSEDSNFYAKVFPKAATNQAHYTLDVSFKPPISGTDLLPIKVSALPDYIYLGGLISVKYSVVNLGTKDSGIFDVVLKLSKDEKKDEEDVTLLTKNADPVTGASKIVFEDLVILPENQAGGNYYVYVDVDTENKVSEVYEDNNVSFSGLIFLDEMIVCADDEFEPNNIIDISTPLPPVSAYYQNLVVCPQLDDYYKIDLPEGIGFSAQVNYPGDPEKGYIYIQLLDESKISIVDESKAATMHVVGLPYVFKAGTYYVRVYNAPKAGKVAPQTYSLSTGVTVPVESDKCAGDKYELNNSIFDPEPIGCGLNKPTLCKKDKDFYKVVINAGNLLSLTLTHPDNQLKMSLYDSQDTSQPLKSIVQNGKIEYLAPVDALYYVGIEPKSPTLNLSKYNYNLFVDGIHGKDLYIEGITVQPEAVYQGENAGLLINIGNQCMDQASDVSYKIFLSSDDKLSDDDKELAFETLQDPVDGYEIYKTFIKAIIPFETVPGKYYLLVQIDPSSKIDESQKDNNISSVPVTVLEFCQDDFLEPNNSPLQATEVSAGKFSNLMLCPSDLDWYKINITPIMVFKIILTMNSKDGDLDLRLYDALNPLDPLEASSTGNNPEVIEYIIDKEGEYLVRVDGFLGSKSGYDIEFLVY